MTFYGDFTKKSRLFSLDNKRQTAPIIVVRFQPIRKGQKYRRVYKGAISSPQHQLQSSKLKDDVDVYGDLYGVKRCSS